MRGGHVFLLSAATLAMAGCTASAGQVQVRALADPASKLGTGSERLAEARGQLVLGNVGLAIEGFRAALREQPDSVEAMRGLAASYDAMGRTDLSRRYYEAALAVAPRDPRSLNALAQSLEGQGKVTQAREVRSEAVAAAAAKPAALSTAYALAPAPVAGVGRIVNDVAVAAVGSERHHRAAAAKAGGSRSAADCADRGCFRWPASAALVSRRGCSPHGW